LGDVFAAAGVIDGVALGETIIGEGEGTLADGDEITLGDAEGALAA
jgi:hypothetical protein